MATLLIIEDDPYVLEIYGRVFTEQDYTVETARDGDEGMQKATSLIPNLVLLDIMIPKINGFEVLEKIKGNPKTKHIPVIMLTNLSEDQFVKKAIGLGADGFMIKAQFSLQKMVEKVEEKLRSTLGGGNGKSFNS